VWVRVVDTDEIIALPRISFTFRAKRGLDVIRTQFPLRLCYAVTFHKSQGETLDRVLLHLQEPVHEHGMLYVGLSRVRCRADIKILTETGMITPEGNARTINIVNRALLEA
jgi:hypothetical protein